MALGTACSNSSSQESPYLVDKLPNEHPLPLFIDLSEGEEIIHKGIFSNDLKEYYFVVSDPGFENFTVKTTRKTDGKWSLPEEAFFNSPYNDHGMSFSPDGKTLYFSSTRPVHSVEVANTWHLWKSDFRAGSWNDPKYVDIPNLRNNLTSHPSITADGTLYFHSSNPDYSEMDLYFSRLVDGRFQDAKRVFTDNMARCTPFVSAKGEHLLFASIDTSLSLMISRSNEKGWDIPMKLPAFVNENGQGNPSITPDGEFLLYTSANPDWKVHWVATDLIDGLLY